MLADTAPPVTSPEESTAMSTRVVPVPNVGGSIMRCRENASGITPCDSFRSKRRRDCSAFSASGRAAKRRTAVAAASLAVAGVDKPLPESGDATGVTVLGEGAAEQTLAELLLPPPFVFVLTARDANGKCCDHVKAINNCFTTHFTCGCHHQRDFKVPLERWVKIDAGESRVPDATEKGGPNDTTVTQDLFELHRPNSCVHRNGAGIHMHRTVLNNTIHVRCHLFCQLFNFAIFKNVRIDKELNLTANEA
jgi:hypothetical protein